MPELGTILSLAIIFGSIVLSISLHEAMHAYMSHYLGDDTAYLSGRLTLNPLAHIDPWLTIAMPLLLALSGLPPFGAAKPVPFNPAKLKYDEYGAALVAIAGPLTNLVLAVIAGIWVRLFLNDAGIFTDIFVMFTVVNLSFFVFNLIPFPPLDGSRVLFAFAPDSVRQVMREIERYGLLGFAIFFIFLFSFIQPILIWAIDALLQVILGTSISVI